MCRDLFSRVVHCFRNNIIPGNANRYNLSYNKQLETVWLSLTFLTRRNICNGRYCSRFYIQLPETMALKKSLKVYASFHSNVFSVIHVSYVCYRISCCVVIFFYSCQLLCWLKRNISLLQVTYISLKYDFERFDWIKGQTWSLAVLYLLFLFTL